MVTQLANQRPNRANGGAEALLSASLARLPGRIPEQLSSYLEKSLPVEISQRAGSLLKVLDLIKDDPDATAGYFARIQTTLAEKVRQASLNIRSHKEVIPKILRLMRRVETQINRRNDVPA